MTAYKIIQSSRVDGYGVVQTLENLASLPLGTNVNIQSSTRGLDGNSQVVWSLVDYELLRVDDDGTLVFDYDEPRPNQLIFPNAGADLDYGPDSGQVVWEPQASWITSANVEEWLGISAATSNDTAFIATCVAASNVYCYRVRHEAGYGDDTDVVPDASVKLGATMMAATLYRERGSVDSFSSFDQMGAAVPFGTMARIKQLLGIGRPQIG
tara:strand:- start:154 stop:786 length:633 start_codon:yes stop_codon:yes gene_type:complete